MARNVTMEEWGFLSPDSTLFMTGREILPCVSTAHRRGWDHASPFAAAVAESQCLRGALGEVGQGGVSRADDPVRGRVAPPCADAVCDTFHHERNHQGKGNVLLFR